MSTRYGAGLDWRLNSTLYLGAEISWRQLEEPTVIDSLSNSVNTEDRKEEFHNLYLYWTPTDQLALKAEFTYDLYRSQRGVAAENGSVPLAVETFSAPLSLSYFDNKRLLLAWAGLSSQKLRLAETAVQKQGNDSFFLVDADIGFRFPKRWGLASIGVKNLFNTRFQYQDDSYREFRDEPSTGPLFPDRILMGRVVLNF